MIMGWLMGDYGMVGGARFMDCISLKTFETWDDWFPEKSLECCGNVMKLQHYAAENIWIHKPQLFCEDQGIPGFLHG